MSGHCLSACPFRWQRSRFSIYATQWLARGWRLHRVMTLLAACVCCLSPCSRRAARRGGPAPKLRGALANPCCSTRCPERGRGAYDNPGKSAPRSITQLASAASPMAWGWGTWCCRKASREPSPNLHRQKKTGRSRRTGRWSNDWLLRRRAISPCGGGRPGRSGQAGRPRRQWGWGLRPRC